MSACFLPALSEMVRLTLLPDVESPELVVTLEPVENQGNRARAGARFWVTVSLSWGAIYSDAWANGVQVVDTRGYPVVWQFADVAKWLVKALSGAPCVVTVRMTDAAQVPAKWTNARAAAALLKVSALDVESIQDSANAKIESVQGWAASTRKTAVIDAGEHMLEAADLLLAVQGIQADGAIDGGGGGGVAADIVGFDDAEYLSPGAPFQSQFEQAGDVDYFRLDLGNFSFSLQIEPFGANPLNGSAVGVTLYDANRYPVNSWSDYFNGPMGLNLPGPGIYFIAVDSNTGYGDCLGQYQITLILNPQA